MSIRIQPIPTAAIASYYLQIDRNPGNRTGQRQRQLGNLIED